MRTLEAVEIARDLMTQGSEWGVWLWLLEKPRVRRAADPELLLVAKGVKDADEHAQRAVAEAESLFDEAERRMSAELARQAAKKALESYDLRERAIRKAEAACRL